MVEEDVKEFYQERGLGARVGFGSSPALVVIDFMRGFTTPSFDLGADYDEELEVTNRISQAVREAGFPVIYFVASYRDDGEEAPIWLSKMPSGKKLKEGSKWVELDPALEVLDEDIVVHKKYASAFFGTHLPHILTSHGVDTVLVTGCTTSGCVRATVVDGCQYGYRTVVVEDAVGDRAEAPHQANLFDMDSKYADVVPSDEVLEYLSSIASDRE